VVVLGKDNGHGKVDAPRLIEVVGTLTEEILARPLLEHQSVQFFAQFAQRQVPSMSIFRGSFLGFWADSAWSLREGACKLASGQRASGDRVSETKSATGAWRRRGPTEQSR
jgi:hypothetical protein